MRWIELRWGLRTYMACPPLLASTACFLVLGHRMGVSSSTTGGAGSSASAVASLHDYVYANAYNN